ncbi:uncharacterized protein LOC129719922 [Wyeomyia smithii]|uniref:uncharacterized protein LOC129719922 n=1 Tax=Wyeomyia smithii TaxID=174621 RepID=UPI0024680C12|nr:uncharacterized protein LOC129719922 [Wyeomyia smithii]
MYSWTCLLVRLFVPRVMNCTKCKQLGHTASHCGNKERCGKCGEQHADDACDKDAEKCLHCGQTPHELSVCPAYKQRQDKIKRSLKERSKRTFAEMLKEAAATKLISPNPYEVLSSDESDSDSSVGETAFAEPGKSRKIKKPLFPQTSPERTEEILT